MEKYDAVIIGGGLGGLVAGAKLAKEGKKVMLLEQHNIPGGCATNFKRKDYIMEVGLHMMDGLNDKDPKRAVFNDLGVFERVEFVNVDEFFRYTSKRMKFVMPINSQDAIAALTEKFPTEERGIKVFFKIIDKINDEFCRLPQRRWKILGQLPIFPMMYPYMTRYVFAKVGDVLDSIIGDEDLKLLLLGNINYYTDDPYSLSMLAFGSVQSSYFKGGGHFIKGGSQRLSDAFADVIRQNGGMVLLGHIAEKILLRGNKAVGVAYRKTKGKNPKTHEIVGDYIIANAAVPNVVQMLPEKQAARLQRNIKGKKYSVSLMSVYVGFNKVIKELGNKYYSTYLSNDTVRSISDLKANHRGSFKERNFYFIDYSQIDSGLAPEGKTTGFICSVDYMDEWEGLSRKEYVARKEEVAQSYFERLEKEIPGIRDAIECYYVATSKTIQRYTLNPKGAPYGFDQIPSQAGLLRQPIKSPVKNLYFASAWSFPGGGFSGAMLTGWQCALEILKK